MSLSSPCCLSQLAASGVGVLLALPVFGIFAARRALGSRLIYAACLAVCAGLAGVALITLLSPAARLESVEIPIGLPLARTFLGLDPLSAAFAGMNLVLLAQDAFSFLVGWELMSLASWALVLSEHRSAENRRAALVYLIMASGGALTLLLAFGLLAGAQGGYAFEAIRRVSAPGVGPIVLLLALVGAGSKAGLVPLHAWLPLAHPAAPSHV